MLQFYGYAKCSTCVKAKKILKESGADFAEKDITVEAPPRRLLQKILGSGSYGIRDLFNKSGQVYREMGLAEKLKGMPEEKMLDLLASNGRLVKRPVLSDGERHVVGLNEARIKEYWGRRS